MNWADPLVCLQEVQRILSYNFYKGYSGNNTFWYTIANILGYALFLCNCLIGLFVRYKCIEPAQQVFDNMSECESLSHKLLLVGYMEFGDVILVLNVRLIGIHVSCISWIFLITSYGDFGKYIKAIGCCKGVRNGSFSPNICAIQYLFSLCVQPKHWFLVC